MTRFFLSLSMMTFTLLACRSSGGGSSGLRDIGTPATAPVAIESGQITGQVLKGSDGDVMAFKGIPFAAPPVGNNRWKEPQPPASWTDVRPMTNFSKACLQPKANFAVLDVGAQSEDCLYINVFVPVAAKAKTPLPVIFWVHGGGYSSGAASLYSAEDLASKGAIVVSFNYRLGVYGFLVERHLIHTDGESFVGNYAFTDHLAALKWLKRNIAAFGGDPNLVTVMGQSAGASSVYYLLTNATAKGQFQRAIALSGGFPGAAVAPQPYLDGDTFVANIGCNKTADVLECMRGVSPETIDKGAEKLDFDTFHDNRFITDNAAKIVAQNAQSKVPLMIGQTKDESSKMTPQPADYSVEKYKAYLKKWYGSGAEKVIQSFPAANDSEAWTAARSTDLASFTAGQDTVLREWARQKLPVYQYTFNRLAPNTAAYKKGVFHGIDMFYLFGWYKKFQDFEAVDNEIANTMQRYLVNFATSGNPNLPVAVTPEWPAWNSNRAFIHFEASPPEIGMDLCSVTQAQCPLFEGIESEK